MALVARCRMSCSRTLCSPVAWRASHVSMRHLFFVKQDDAGFIDARNEKCRGMPAPLCHCVSVLSARRVVIVTGSVSATEETLERASRSRSMACFVQSMPSFSRRGESSCLSQRATVASPLRLSLSGWCWPRPRPETCLLSSVSKLANSLPTTVQALQGVRSCCTPHRLQSKAENR